MALHGKYKSGNCGVFARTFLNAVKEQFGAEGQSIAKPTENAWTGLPLPGTEESRIKWNALSAAVQGADHTNAGFAFRNEYGRESYLQFACSFEKDKKTRLNISAELENDQELIASFLSQGSIQGLTFQTKSLTPASLQRRPLKVVTKLPCQKTGIL